MRTPALLSFSLACLACGTPSAPGDPVVGRVGSVEIHAHQLQMQAPALARLYPRELAYAGNELDRRVFLLRQLFVQELVLEAARERGYDRRFPDPRQASEHYLEDEVRALGKASDLSAADVGRYYLDHLRELSTPERVRVLEVVTRERGVADRVVELARTAKQDGISEFLDLVQKYTEERSMPGIPGDLGLLTKDDSRLPPALVRAAFSLPRLFHVSDPIEVRGQFHVLKVVQRLPGHQPTLAEAATVIRASLAQRLFEQKKDAFAQLFRLRKRNEIEYAELLTVELPPDLYLSTKPSSMLGDALAQ